VLLGGAYGGGWIGGGEAGQPSAPIEWNEAQAVPKPVADPSDAEWRQRAEAPVLEPETLPPERRASRQAPFGLCHSGGGTNCVVDGDTIWIAGQNVRLADIDTPETHEPRCASELELGNRATARLHQLVNEGEVTLSTIDRDSDVHGRKLRLVLVNGVSVGETLVGEGLARWYEGGRKSWCG
jgi:endonuclease YncB( thermonuclease family)